MKIHVELEISGEESIQDAIARQVGANLTSEDLAQRLVDAVDDPMRAIAAVMQGIARKMSVPPRTVTFDFRGTEPEIVVHFDNAYDARKHSSMYP